MHAEQCSFEKCRRDATLEIEIPTYIDGEVVPVAETYCDLHAWETVLPELDYGGSYAWYDLTSERMGMHYNLVED